MNHTTTADILDESASYIEKYGWTQYQYEESDGSVCAMGAMIRVSNDTGAVAASRWELNCAMQFLAAFVHAPNPRVPRVWSTCIGSWNDNPDRTEQEVLDTLRLAAKTARSLDD